VRQSHRTSSGRAAKSLEIGLFGKAEPHRTSDGGAAKSLEIGLFGKAEPHRTSGGRAAKSLEIGFSVRHSLTAHRAAETQREP